MVVDVPPRPGYLRTTNHGPTRTYTGQQTSFRTTRTRTTATMSSSTKQMMVEVNEEVTEVGQMLNLYEQWKVAGTHSKAVSFHKVANALGKIEKAVRQNDGAHFSKALEKSSPLFERLDDSVQALVAALTEVHEKLNPEYFQTGGAQSTEMAGSRVEVDEAGAGILSENTGAQRFIGSKMKATARTAFASDNHLTGDQAVVVATSSHLVSGGQIFSGNTGKRGRDNYLGARLSQYFSTIFELPEDVVTDSP
ncbi:hypothetical protein BDV98DRAFT_212488 [Pterulicium gracile]|uniref:Uncharacterized protein n=1 Tax=Pterulicium gracile TaxID=1884261 RepID=A0A5C3QCI5_9AGAR|nr:hypothetical protein BDV98DRAFT_212488 [Pterula gracilis]